MNDPQSEGHMASYIGRRKFLASLSGAAAAWPLAARWRADEPQLGRSGSANPYRGVPAGTAEFGWAIGRTLRVEYRWGADADRVRKSAAELVALAPDVIVANAPLSVIALQ